MCSKRSPLIAWALIGLYMSSLGSPIPAQGATPRGDSSQSGGDARLQALVQQLSTENAQLTQSNSDLQQRLEDVTSERDELKEEKAKQARELQARQREIAVASAEKGNLADQNETLRDRLEQLVGRYRELADLLKTMQQERDTLASMAEDYDERVVGCEENNEALYTIALELIDKYENKGFLRTLLQNEPVTGLQRTRIENMMDEYRYLAEEMRLEYGVETGAEEPAAVDTNGERPAG